MNITLYCLLLMKQDIIWKFFRPAFQMLQRMKHRPTSDAFYSKACEEFLKEYESLGHMVEMATFAKFKAHNHINLASCFFIK